MIGNMWSCGKVSDKTFSFLVSNTSQMVGLANFNINDRKYRVEEIYIEANVALFKVFQHILPPHQFANILHSGTSCYSFSTQT